MQHITIDPRDVHPPTWDFPSSSKLPTDLPNAKEVKLHPSKAGGENGSLYFVGTATTIIEWEGIRIMTDPNFLKEGDLIHVGEISSARRTNPAIGIHELPRIDLVLLTHYHADHFDEKVEQQLRRDLPIITTPHAKGVLISKGPQESFTQVYGLETYQQMTVNVKCNGGAKQPRLRVTALPGKHILGNEVPDELKELASLLPPTNGWMFELGRCSSSEPKSDFSCSYRIYITGDTMIIDELKEIPKRYAGQKIDLMLAHLGGAILPSPALLPKAVMVTMDGKQGVELIKMIQPELTIPIHYDDYEVFASPLEDFQKVVEEARLGDKVVCLDRKEQYKFRAAD